MNQQVPIKTIAGATGRPVDRPSVPLVIDLDGTLCRTDTLHEQLFSLLTKTPLMLRHIPKWLIGGKALFKQMVARHGIVDPTALPYDEDLLQFIQTQRAKGRQVVLVSASHHRQVEAVAAHLGVFDLSIGTGSLGIERNLRGEAKAAFLIDVYGVGGFDYVGDDACDIPVWAAARKAYGIRLPYRIEAKAASQGIVVKQIGKVRPSVSAALVKACRPHQWAKNLLILLPVLSAQDVGAIPAALFAMLCFSLAASAIYIVNDLVDLASDRAHPRKRQRPFASGAASVGHGLALATLLLTASVTLATLLPAAFMIVLLAYLAATSAYSFSLKRKMMVDVIALASLYTLRIIAGSMATGISLSPWLMVFSMFLFFALATIKRQAELEDMTLRGVEKTIGRNLILSDLPILQSLSTSTMAASVLVFALYARDPDIGTHFAVPDLLLLICPILFLWLGRMQLMTRRGYMTDDPIVFTLRDRPSLICGLSILLIFVAAAQGPFI